MFCWRANDFNLNPPILQWSSSSQCHSIENGSPWVVRSRKSPLPSSHLYDELLVVIYVCMLIFFNYFQSSFSGLLNSARVIFGKEKLWGKNIFDVLYPLEAITLSIALHFLDFHDMLDIWKFQVEWSKEYIKYFVKLIPNY